MPSFVAVGCVEIGEKFMLVGGGASIHIYANKCEAIYMSADAAFFYKNKVYKNI